MSWYQTITGKLQATVEGGVLYRREWEPVTGHTGTWVRVCALQDTLAVQQLRDDWDAQTAGSTAEYRLGCCYCCAVDHRPCSWHVEQTSERLTREIEALLVRREEALAYEKDQRPGRSE